MNSKVFAAKKSNHSPKINSPNHSANFREQER